MTLALDLPAAGDSPLHRLDPRWKLAALLLAALAAALVRTGPAAAAALVGAAVLVGLARLPPRWVLPRLGTGLLLLVLFMAWLPFVPRPGDLTVDVGPLALSLTGLARLGVLLAKAAALVALMLVLVATAPLHDTFKAAHDLRVPNVLVGLTLLTYRYVFLLAEEFDRLRTALRVRGFRNRPDLHSYRTIGQVAGTLLVRSHERAERLAQAMRCRGFDGRFRTRHAFRTTAADVLAFALVVGYAACVLAGDGLGR